jgi:hypothetical protein
LSPAVELIPLRCLRCDTPVPAEPDEIAWACERCGQGMLLDESLSLAPLEIHTVAGIPAGTAGRPFWVASGRVTLGRDTYGSSWLGNKTGEAERFWSQPRPFTIPAFACALDDLLAMGAHLILNPPPLKPGPAAPFQPVILPPADLPALAEFVVLALEAGRRDQLKKVEISVNLGEPELWILPP